MLGWNAFWALFWALVFFSSCHHRGSWTVQQQILPHTPHRIRHHPVRNNGILRVQLIRNTSNFHQCSNTSDTLSPLHQGFRKFSLFRQPFRQLHELLTMTTVTQVPKVSHNCRKLLHQTHETVFRLPWPHIDFAQPPLRHLRQLWKSCNQ